MNKPYLTRQTIVVVLVCLAMFGAGCAGWGTDGPVEDDDATPDEADDLDSAQADDPDSDADGVSESEPETDSSDDTDDAGDHSGDSDAQPLDEDSDEDGTGDGSDDHTNDSTPADDSPDDSDMTGDETDTSTDSADSATDDGTGDSADDTSGGSDTADDPNGADDSASDDSDGNGDVSDDPPANGNDEDTASNGNDGSDDENGEASDIGDDSGDSSPSNGGDSGENNGTDGENETDEFYQFEHTIQVVDHNGDPVTGQQVEVYPVGGPESVETHTTDENGEIVATGGSSQPDHAVQMEAQTEGADTHSFHLDNTPTESQIELDAPEETHTLTVVPGPEPVPGANILIDGDAWNDEYQQATSEDGGPVTFELPNGQYLVGGDDPNQNTQTIPIEIDGSDKEVQLGLEPAYDNDEDDESEDSEDPIENGEDGDPDNDDG